jgi:hypothetical protein
LTPLRLDWARCFGQNFGPDPARGRKGKTSHVHDPGRPSPRVCWVQNFGLIDVRDVYPCGVDDEDAHDHANADTDGPGGQPGCQGWVEVGEPVRCRCGQVIATSRRCTYVDHELVRWERTCVALIPELTRLTEEGPEPRDGGLTHFGTSVRGHRGKTPTRRSLAAADAPPPLCLTAIEPHTMAVWAYCPNCGTGQRVAVPSPQDVTGIRDHLIYEMSGDPAMFPYVEYALTPLERYQLGERRPNMGIRPDLPGEVLSPARARRNRRRRLASRKLMDRFAELDSLPPKEALGPLIDLLFGPATGKPASENPESN